MGRANVTLNHISHHSSIISNHYSSQFDLLKSNFVPISWNIRSGLQLQFWSWQSCLISHWVCSTLALFRHAERANLKHWRTTKSFESLGADILTGTDILHRCHTPWPLPSKRTVGFFPDMLLFFTIAKVSVLLRLFHAEVYRKGKHPAGQKWSCFRWVQWLGV